MRSAWITGVAGVLLAASAAGAAPQRALTVRVTMTSTACRATPAVVEPGPAVFSIANRTRRVRLFTVAGRRTGYIRPRRTGRLQVRLSRAGTYRYFCISRGPRRNPRTGVLAVRSPRSPKGSPAEHWIAVRPAGAVLELYDRFTNQRFVPRGSNYVRLSPQAGVGLYHSTFNVGTYEGDRAETALARMRAQGYNTVRVFLNGLCLNACVGDRMRGISGPYAANVADFLRRAKAQGLLVIVTIDHVPVGTRYWKFLDAEPRDLVDRENLNFLTTGGLRANADFWHDFAAELVRQRAATDVILGYELRNEAFFDGASKPFTLTSGLLRAPNGKTYDLAQPAERRALIDDGLRFWIDQVRSAIRRADPTALVAVGFFEPQEPNPSRSGDSRIIRTRAAIRESTADFVDIHTYPRVRLTLAQYMQNFGIDGAESKPVIIGEMGAFRSALPRLEEVPYTLQAWQRDACSFGIDGWLTWTWDTDEQSELWNALSGGGLIERALAPASRPDPCATPAGAHNLALGRPASASISDASKPPDNAFDGSLESAWSSGDFPPQWIEVDLGAPETVARARLHVTQLPDGPTVHRVWGRASELQAWRLLHEFSALTSSGEVLDHAPPTPWQSVRYVRVETISSSSFVGWREIELVSPG